MITEFLNNTVTIMYKQKISITINSKFKKDQIFDEFESLLGSLWKTGQIEGPFETPY